MRLFAAILLLALAGIAPAQEKPLNFILVVVDDMGWMDLTCQGSDFYQTPNIDRLASEGMRFTNGYAACAVCSPSRAAVQTGRHPHRVGVTDWIRSRFQRGDIGTPEANPTEYEGTAETKLLCPPNPYWMVHEEITLAEALREQNYQTAYIGKWHLGDPGWYPEHQGFVENRGGCDYGQPPSFFDPYNKPDGRHETLREGIYKLPGREEGEYLTHREAAEAVELIRGWKDEPFFIQISHYAVHTPIQAIPEVAAKYENALGETQKNTKYAAMVESVDDAMGSILETLKELNLDDRTVILFTSDNGGLDIKNGPTDNAPLRSGKGFAYEGGIRVPFLVRSPGRVAQGKVSDAPVTLVDIFPTFLDMAGVALPADRVIDGVSLVPHLASGGATAIDRNELIWHFPHYRHGRSPYSILRQGDWKLIKFWEGPMELYHLGDDLSEEINLAGENPEKVEAMNTRLVSLLKSSEAKLPIENPDYTGK